MMSCDVIHRVVHTVYEKIMGLLSRIGGLLVLIALITLAEGTPSLREIIGSRDKQRLQNLFQNTLLTDLETAYYVAGGVASFGKEDAKVKQAVCQFLKKNSPTGDSLTDIFYATSAAAALGCDVSYDKFEKTLNNMLNMERNLTEIYWIASSLTNIKKDVPQSITLPNLVSLTEKEETILSYGYAFSTGALLSGTLSSLMYLVEDVVAQADETPTTLYFEEGLVITSFALSSMLQLATKANIAPTITPEQATKFGNYLVASKYTICIKEAFYLLQAARLLAINKFVVPAGLLRTDHKSINAKEPSLTVSFTNILGEGIRASTVMLKTVTDPSGEKETRNKPFTADSDGIRYNIQLTEQVKVPGTYKILLSTESKGDSVVAELSNVEFEVTVSFMVGVASVELAVIEKEQNVAVKSLSLQYPNAASEILVADHHSKVKMTFDLINQGTKDKVTLHQTFVRLVSVEEEEIFFVATHTPDKTYTFELDVAKTAKESFNSKSGTYSMTLIVGGATIQNPFSWEVGKLTLKFSGTPKETASEEQKYRNKPRPEIQHMFRIPEKRPPAVVSATFSGLVLLPLAILFILWLILGANISNLFLSGAWAILFHIGLASIFFLYYCFWMKLNMFQTLKWLLVLGGMTFVAGNQMLRRIAKQKAI